MILPCSKSFYLLCSSCWLLLAIIIIIIMIIIYYHIRSRNNVTGKIVKFTFLYVHLQLKHEEGFYMNSRQRQMFLNTSLYPVCSGLHLKYYPYKNHRGQIPTVYRVGNIPASASQPGLKKMWKQIRKRIMAICKLIFTHTHPQSHLYFPISFLRSRLFAEKLCCKCWKAVWHAARTLPLHWGCGGTEPTATLFAVQLHCTQLHWAALSLSHILSRRAHDGHHTALPGPARRQHPPSRQLPPARRGGGGRRRPLAGTAPPPRASPGLGARRTGAHAEVSALKQVSPAVLLARRPKAPSEFLRNVSSRTAQLFQTLHTEQNVLLLLCVTAYIFVAGLQKTF